MPAQMTLKTKMSLIMLVVAVVMAVASAGVLKLADLRRFDQLKRAIALK
jgi:sensor domain CHASE-containing protein